MLAIDYEAWAFGLAISAALIIGIGTLALIVIAWLENGE